MAISMENRQKETGFKTDAMEYILNATLTATAQGLSPKEMGEKGKQVLLAMGEMEPQDSFEGILVSQMLTAYDQAMKCFTMADFHKDSSKFFERYMNQGVKLMRLYNQQMDTLDKHRRGGNQKMTVEHVHVNEGGQAIIGDVTQGRKGGNQ